MNNNFEIRDLLYNKHNIEQNISSLIYGSIEIKENKSNKYIYVHYRENGLLLTKYVGEYRDELYNMIVSNNLLVNSLKKELRIINKELKKYNFKYTELSDKVKLNIDYAKRNLVDTIYNQAILEGIRATFLETEKIIEGGMINGMTSTDIVKVVNLKHAWEFILSENVILSDTNIYLLSQINKLVEEGFYYSAGRLRTIPVRISGTKWLPKLPIESVIKEELEIIYNKNISIIDKAIELLLYVMKSQMFIDGNKRTAVIFANHYLVKNGKGIVVIPDSKVEEFRKLLLDYYNDINIDKIKIFLKENCIQEL